jgi:hypothetical protein
VTFGPESIRTGKIVEESGVEVGDHHPAGRPDRRGKPASDASPAAADLPTVPACTYTTAGQIVVNHLSNPGQPGDTGAAETRVGASQDPGSWKFS